MSDKVLRLSIVIPAYNAAKTICVTLESIFGADKKDGDFDIEIIVVDDGSADRETLKAELVDYPQVQLIHHEDNLGMCAGRNTGIFASTGDIVMILDADDRLVSGWPDALKNICDAWPEEFNLCWAGCLNARGETTLSHPEYSGPMTREDFLREKYTGEYLPIFRGGYARKKGYVDLGTRKSCGLLSYVTFVQDSPFWLSATSVRIYEDGRANSVTSGWSRPEKAAESAQCLESVLERYGDQYLEVAPRIFGGKFMRLAIYRKLAGQTGAWKAFFSGFGKASLVETGGAVAVLLLGRGFCVAAVNAARNFGLVRRYG